MNAKTQRREDKKRRRIGFSSLLFLCVFASSRSLSAAPTGLDALDENAFLINLAAHGQTTLLDRALQTDHITSQMAQSLHAIAELRSSEARTPQQREEVARAAAQAIVAALPQLSDAKTMMELASILIADGAARDVNTLEYWGENLATMSNLRPVGESISALYAKAAEEAKTKADGLANQIKSTDDPLIPQYEQLATIAQNAQYTKAMADYMLALSIDSADPKRTEIAKSAISFLTKFDNADSQVQPSVRNRIAKFDLLLKEYPKAAELFDSVAQAKDVKPQPSVAQQYEARYFAAIAQLDAGNTDDAQARLDQLTTWQSTALTTPQARAGAAAGTAILQYRIYIAKQNRDQAIAVLLKLVKDRPDLSATIYQQLITQLPDDADLTKLDPLLLRAIVQRGDEERLRDTGTDKKIIARAASAAEELFKRSNVDTELHREAELTYPFLLEKLDRPMDEAKALLDYTSQYPTHETATLTLDAAENLLANLRKQQGDDPQVTALYERFLSIAINPPFSRKQFAFEYAARLQHLGKYADAAKYFALVPETDKRKLQADYFRLLALKQQMDQNDPSVSRNDLVQLAEQIAAKSKQDPQIAARTKLLAADLDQKNAVTILKDFEQLTANLPNKNELLAQAMTLRVMSYMSTGDNDSATRELVALLQQTDGAEGADIVFKLLTRLNTDFDRAAATNNESLQRSIANNRASLSGFLVKWAKENSDERIRSSAPRYALFDAESHRLAAELDHSQPDLTEALKLYQSLDQKDPLVTLGVALTQFDLGHFTEAQPMLAQLLASRSLGPAIVVSNDSGTETLTDNDRYWEATWKLFRCNIELANSNPNAVKETTNALKRLYIEWGDRTGGKKWHAQFEALKRQLAPDFK